MGQIINIKYDVGDNIRYIDRKRKPILIDCPCCGGKGYVMGCDGNPYDCGECEGQGKYHADSWEEELCEKTGTICRAVVKYDTSMSSFHGEAEIYYNVPHSTKNISQDDVIERIESEQEKLAYSD